jgi:hypothetical protein
LQVAPAGADPGLQANAVRQSPKVEQAISALDAP